MSAENSDYQAAGELTDEEFEIKSESNKTNNTVNQSFNSLNESIEELKEDHHFDADDEPKKPKK